MSDVVVMQILGGLGGGLVEFPALSHFTRGSWVHTPVGSRDFLTIPTSPAERVPKNPTSRKFVREKEMWTIVKKIVKKICEIESFVN